MSTVITKNLQIGADGTASNNFTVYQPAAPDGTLRIGNGNTGTTSAQVVLTSAGDVGIGTSSPTGKFNVSGSVANDLTTFSTADAATTVLNNVNGVATGRATKILFRNSGLNLAGVAGVYTGFNGAGDLAGALAFGTQTNAAGGVVERMRIDSAGNVGIGTSSPGAPLDVNGTIVTRASGGEGGQVSFNNPDNASVGLVVDVSSADTARVFQGRNNSLMQIGQLAGTGGIVTFFTAANERARIHSSGGVSVASTVDPGAANLSVAGSVKANVALGSGAGFDVSGQTGLTVAASSNAVLISGPGYYLVPIAEVNSTGQNATYMLGNGSVTLLGGTGSWIGPTSTPGATQFSIFYDGTNYRLYRGSGGGTCVFKAAVIRVHG